jgi:2'-5' RNA ligase
VSKVQSQEKTAVRSFGLQKVVSQSVFLPQKILQAIDPSLRLDGLSRADIAAEAHQAIAVLVQDFRERGYRLDARDILYRFDPGVNLDGLSDKDIKREALAVVDAMAQWLHESIGLMSLHQDAIPEENKLSSVMLGFWIPRAIAQPLLSGVNFADKETEQNLHLTVCDLGKWEQLPELDTLVRNLANFCWGHPIIPGVIGGQGRFNASESSDHKDVIYASVDGPSLAEFRQGLIDLLAQHGIPVVQNHGFTPHITLAYVPPNLQAQVFVASQEINLDQLTLAVGEKHYVFFLDGSNIRRSYSPVEEIPAEREDAKDNRPTRPGFVYVKDPSVKGGGYWRKAPKKGIDAGTALGIAAGVGAVGLGAAVLYGARQAKKTTVPLDPIPPTQPSLHNKTALGIAAGVGAAGAGAGAIYGAQQINKPKNLALVTDPSYEFPSTDKIISELKPLSHSAERPSGYHLFTSEIEGKTYFVKEQPSAFSDREEASYAVARVLNMSDFVLPAKSIRKNGKTYVASPFLEGKAVGYYPFDRYARDEERQRLQEVMAANRDDFKSGKISKSQYEAKRDELFEGYEAYNNETVKLEQEAVVKKQQQIKDKIQQIGEAKIKKMVLFDYVINIADRHAYNVFADDGKVTLIDNALTHYDLGKESGYISQKVEGYETSYYIPPTLKLPKNNVFVKHLNESNKNAVFEKADLTAITSRRKELEAAINASIQDPEEKKVALFGLRKRIARLKQIERSNDLRVSQLWE